MPKASAVQRKMIKSKKYKLMSSLGDKITEIGTGEWKFNEAVADNFENTS